MQMEVTIRIVEFVTAAFCAWRGFWTEIHLGRRCWKSSDEEVEEEYAEVDSHLWDMLDFGWDGG